MILGSLLIGIFLYMADCGITTFNILILSDVGLELHERLALLEDISNCILEGSLRLEPYPVSIRLINTLVFFMEYRRGTFLLKKQY